MFEFHKDRKRYFDMQIENTHNYVLPFIEKKCSIQPGMRILEIGCGEGGVLKAFIDKGCKGVGVELDETRLVNARLWLQKDIERGAIHFISKNIYDTTANELGGAFDVIILKDVIEHIHDQPKLMRYMQTFLNKNGVIFFGFPPWQMPLGGHQQICKNKWLSKIPYYHLLPKSIYKWILKSNGENWEEMLEIKETGISIERFEKIVGQTGYTVLHHTHYLINPIYQYKFGWKPRTQFSFIKAIPWVRNFFTSCVYYLIQRQ
ncbi:class I SAM-dependent methyltransferase [Ferruginibacter yonginensis]|uniref:Class I SAM-dependent methyltransferase n=1 Tax=Ferruginibacter yonginensis TaxID=1310416 RepID=A0ABV8QMN7_9BACT